MLQFNSASAKRHVDPVGKIRIWSGPVSNVNEGEAYINGECHVSWGWGVRSLDQIIAADWACIVSMGIKTHDLPTLFQRGQMVRSAAIRSLIEWSETLPNAFMTWDTHHSEASPTLTFDTGPDQILIFPTGTTCLFAETLLNWNMGDNN